MFNKYFYNLNKKITSSNIYNAFKVVIKILELKEIIFY